MIIAHSDYVAAYDIDDDDVEHVGIKGMRWGVRKQKIGTGTKKGTFGKVAKKVLKGTAITAGILGLVGGTSLATILAMQKGAETGNLPPFENAIPFGTHPASLGGKPGYITPDNRFHLLP